MKTDSEKEILDKLHVLHYVIGMKKEKNQYYNSIEIKIFVLGSMYHYNIALKALKRYENISTSFKSNQNNKK